MGYRKFISCLLSTSRRSAEKSMIGGIKMDLSPLFKSMIDQDNSAVVICDTTHTIVYMNPAACARYAKRGGAALVGKSLLDCHNGESNALIVRVLDWFRADPAHNSVHTFYNEQENKDVYMIALRDDTQDSKLIGYYEKHAYRDRDMTPFYELG